MITTGSILTYIGCFLTLSWGIAHLFPTMNVVRGFGKMTEDNKRILIMEWIGEGTTLIFIGVLVALVTYFDRCSMAAKAVYWTSFGVLNVMSLVSLFTGFKNTFLPFKLCPFIFTGSSILILIGGYLK